MGVRSGASWSSGNHPGFPSARARRRSGYGIAAGVVALVLLSACASPAAVGDLAEVRAARDAAAADAHAAALDRSAVFLRDKWGPVALPDPPIERWVQAGEWGPTMARCLDDAGFPGVRSADGGERLDFSAVTLASTREYFEIDVAGWVCQARYPVITWFDDDVRAIEAPWAFRYLTSTLVPCLLAHGYNVPVPPDAARFATSWRTDQSFDAYALIGGAAGDRVRAAARCPSPETVLDGAT